MDLRGTRDACPPQGSNFFISMQFSVKIWPNNRLVPPPWKLAPPVWEILDLPLLYIFFSLSLWNCCKQSHLLFPEEVGPHYILSCLKKNNYKAWGYNFRNHPGVSPWWRHVLRCQLWHQRCFLQVSLLGRWKILSNRKMGEDYRCADHTWKEQHYQGTWPATASFCN